MRDTFKKVSTEAQAKPTEAESSGGSPLSSIPPIPRPITRQARRRSWAEMPVRVWIILTLAVAFVTIYFTITRIKEALDNRWLVDHGVDVNATFVEVSGDPVPKRRLRNETMPSTVKFTYGGKEYTQQLELDPKPGIAAVVGTTIALKVDPNDPMQLMEVTVPPPWSHELAIVAALIPVLILVVLMILWKRRGVLRVWRNEPLVEAIVVELRQSPVAPMSRVVRFTLAQGGGQRIWSTLMPASAGIPEIGQHFWIICPPNNPGKAIVAGLYQEL